MWKKYFKVVKVRPGRILTPGHGEIDFSRDDVAVDVCIELFEKDFPYLEITDEGKRFLYGIGEEEAAVEIEQTNELSETVEPEDSPPNRKHKKVRSPK